MIKINQPIKVILDWCNLSKVGYGSTETTILSECGKYDVSISLDLSLVEDLARQRYTEINVHEILVTQNGKEIELNDEDYYDLEDNIKESLIWKKQ